MEIKQSAQLKSQAGKGQMKYDNDRADGLR